MLHKGCGLNAETVAPQLKHKSVIYNITQLNIKYVPVSTDGCSTVNYTSNVHTTNGGRKCQFWEDQGPHRHTNSKNAMFPYDRNVKAARNHCRNQNGDNRPWCYTTDLYRRWEYCDFVICEGTSICACVRLFDVCTTNDFFFVCLSVRLSACLPPYLSVRLSVCLSVHQFVCRPSVCLPQLYVL